MRKLRKDDEIVVTAGKDRGKRGTVDKILAPKKRGRGQRVMVKGINMVKKHVRKNPQAGIEGGIIAQEAAFDASNVAIWNPLTKRADRVGIRILEDGTKVRFFKSNDEVIDV